MDINRIIFKFGDYTFPNEYINWDSISIKPSQRQDLDSYTDASGLTHRNAIEHTKSDVKFATRQLSESQVNDIMNNIVRNYINEKERDAMCTYHNPESRKLENGHFYLDPSLEFSIRGMDTNGEFKYNPINFHFTEY